MCVIFIASKIRPDDNMVKDGWDHNDNGGGIAWRDEEKNVVKWKKGIKDLKEMQELCKTLPMPYIAHFRIASVGGKRDDLCHPFPIDKSVPLFLEGETEGDVLFHNGHWNQWKERCFEASIRSNTPIPSGKWSDTRVMAYLASIYGNGILEFIDEKAVTFGPKGCEIFGSGWKTIEGVYCSNDFFVKRGVTQHTGNGVTSYYTGYKGSDALACRFYNCDLTRLRGREYCAQHRYMEQTFDENDTEAVSTSTTADEKKDDKTVVMGPVQSALAKYEARDKKNKESGGGDHKLLPFSEVKRLYDSDARDLAGRRIISKNRYKKARNAYQKAQRKLHLTTVNQKFHEMTDPPTLIVH
jgi:hypothetical protein